jgi:hypothetical protein
VKRRKRVRELAKREKCSICGKMIQPGERRYYQGPAGDVVSPVHVERSGIPAGMLEKVVTKPS